MGTVPGSASLYGTVAPGGSSAEDVILNGNHPTLGTALDLGSQLIPGGIAVRSPQVKNMIQERQVHLRKIGRISRPVIHLHIDISVYIAMPERGVTAIIPYALQIRGSMNACIQVGTYGKVTSVLEVQSFQEEAVAA